MNTRIRTIIITLIAACSFATATIVPAVSQAARKSKHPALSTNSNKGLSACAEDHVRMTAQLEASAEALAEGDVEGATEHFNMANNDAGLASVDCGGAAREGS